VRIIALLRDPVDRAHSNWAHLWSAGLEPEHDSIKACLVTGESFSDWLDLDVDRFGGRAPLRPLGRIGTAHQSIDRPIRD
jgi:hypothetical protein